jgi:DNA-binding IclR family transcriptional regulator
LIKDFDSSPATVADVESDGRLGIQSIESAMRLISALIEHSFDRPPPMLKTLAASAGMQPAKAHRYMVSLIRSQMVEREEASGRYRLGPMARLLGLRAIQSIDVVRLAGARLPQICAEIGFSVALAIWAFEGPTIIAVEETRRPITIGTRVGEVLPILNSATGLVFGAWMPAGITEDVLRRDAANARRGASDAPTSKLTISALFDRVRKEGIGVTKGGLNPTINALSAPIFDHRGLLVAALSTLGAANELDVAADGFVAVRLRQLAADLSSELGYTPEMTGADVPPTDQS